MDELKATFRDSDVVEVTHDATNVRWTFYVTVDRSGRRNLDGPHGSAEAMAHGDLLQRACTFAQAEALHAGKVDY